jgi:hypothetical protein
MARGCTNPPHCRGCNRDGHYLRECPDKPAGMRNADTRNAGIRRHDGGRNGNHGRGHKRKFGQQKQPYDPRDGPDPNSMPIHDDRRFRFEGVRQFNELRGRLNDIQKQLAIAPAKEGENKEG